MNCLKIQFGFREKLVLIGCESAAYLLSAEIAFFPTASVVPLRQLSSHTAGARVLPETSTVLYSQKTHSLRFDFFKNRSRFGIYVKITQFFSSLGRIAGSADSRG